MFAIGREKEPRRVVSKRQRGPPSRAKGGSGKAGGRLGWIRDSDRTAGRRGTGGDDDDMDGWMDGSRSCADGGGVEMERNGERLLEHVKIGG